MIRIPLEAAHHRKVRRRTNGSGRRIGRLQAGAGLLLAATFASAAQSQTTGDIPQGPASPAVRQSPVPTAEPTEDTVPAGILDRDTLLGTLGGVRTGLAAYGIKLGLSETSEVLGNVSGGRRTGLAYEGLTTASVDLDLPRLGGTARVSAFQIHGRGLSGNNVDNLMTLSSIEATRATRLFELWYQQSFLDGRLDVRLGQQSADLEFATSTYAGLFLNSNFGWPSIFAVDLPSGGPAFPLAALGARLRAKPTDALTVLLGVYDGSPSGLGIGDPQGRRNPSSTRFGLDDGLFAMGEIQYATDLYGRAGTYKFGAWYNSNAFTNQFYTSGGTTAASANAIPPRAGRADWNLYAGADQLLWRKPDAKDGGVGAFLRIAGGPGKYNQVNVFADAGITYKGVFGRDNDSVGLGVGWTRISDSARAGDAAVAAATGGAYPIRTSETVLELTYQAQIIGSIQVQPVFQYVIRPGGGIPNPDRSTERLRDAAIFGVRTNVTF